MIQDKSRVISGFAFVLELIRLNTHRNKHTHILDDIMMRINNVGFILAILFRSTFNVFFYYTVKY